MKKVINMIGVQMLCIVFCIGFTACSNNENEPTIPGAEEISGNYIGDMVGTAMGIDMNFDDVEVCITAADESHVTVTISPFGNPPMKLPEIKVDGVAVSGSDGEYSLAATEFSGVSPDGKNYSGVVKGTVASALELQMNLQYGAMPMPLVCSYTATKK